jgi:hypothetical protein
MPGRGYWIDSITVEYWQAGSVVHKSRAVRYPDGTFITILDGLAPGADYTVLAVAKEFKDGISRKRASMPATIKGR